MEAVEGPIVGSYSTYAEHSRMGKFCLPISERASDLLIDNSQLLERQGFINSWDSFRFCTCFGVALGLLYLVLVQLCPLVMNWVGVIGGGSGVIVLGLLVLLY